MSGNDDIHIAPLSRPEFFGRVIGDLRHTQGLTQAQLAQRLGVSRQYVVELEGGRVTRAVEVIVEAFAQLGYVLQPVREGSRG
ncbi:MAG: helix-turn-helix domain-containing protein [Cellulomonadaceae bacterium]|jgi:transcriptional regulator with XRE-family HTH domain|nr:helix-turn-helix domain-containing protein [Cellulomonadaceae bacterium]